MASRLSRSQQTTVNKFIKVADVKKKVAVEYLQRNDWNLEASVNDFYSNPPAASTANVDMDALNAVFEKYKDPGCDSILYQGVEAYCNDIEVDPQDPLMLVISYHLNAQTMCEYTRTEFVDGWAALGCDSIASMKASFGRLQSLLEDQRRWRDYYAWLFRFGREPGQKSLAIDMAKGLWQLVLTDRWALLPQWIAFLENHTHAISKDTWNLLPELAETHPSSVEGYDDDGSWPVLFDEFVEHMKAKQ